MNEYTDNYDNNDYTTEDDYVYDEDLEKYWEELEKEAEKIYIKRKKTIRSHTDYNENDDDF